MIQFDPPCVNWLQAVPPALCAAGFAAFVPMPAGGSPRQRLSLAVLVWMMLLPSSQSYGQESTLGGDALTQLATGMLVAFAFRVAAAAVSGAARLVELEMGLPIWEGTEELESSTPLASLYQITSVTVFFCAGGHRLVLEALLDMPITPQVSDQFVVALVQRATQLVTGSSWLTLRLAAPVAIALTSANLVTGMMARVLPQPASSGAFAPLQIAGGLVLLLLLTGVISGEVPHTLSLWIRGIAFEMAR